MKIVLLCSGQSNQKALANKINRSAKLDGLVIVSPDRNAVAARNWQAKQIWKRFCSITAGYPLRTAWFGMLRHYDALYPDFPIPPALNCVNVNEPSVFEYISQIKPDLVLVSGTNLLTRALIDEIRKHGRAMNLHTGISPYVKGGPNCTNWCLALRQFSLIGNTVMWIAAGIDDGNIITTEQTPLSGDETLTEIQIAVMEHAHALYLKCIARYIAGEVLPNVSQASFAKQRVFLARQWGGKEMASALFNYCVHFNRDSSYFKLSQNEQLIRLDT